MRRIIVGILLVCLLIGSASAWTIVDSKNRVAGSVDFYGDKTGVVNVTGGPVLNFTWYPSGDSIKVNYLFYGVNIYYNVEKDELYSPDIEGVVLKR